MGEDIRGSGKLASSDGFGDLGVAIRGPLVFSSGRKAIVRCPGRVSRIPSFAFCSASARACDTKG